MDILYDEVSNMSQPSKTQENCACTTCQHNVKNKCTASEVCKYHNSPDLRAVYDEGYKEGFDVAWRWGE